MNCNSADEHASTRSREHHRKCGCPSDRYRSGEHAVRNAETVRQPGTGDGPGTVTRRHDWGGTDPLSATVVEAAVAARDDDSQPDPSLWAAIDPDGLDCLFQSVGEGTRSNGRLTFEFAGCEVTVEADGLVRSRLLSTTAGDEAEDASEQTPTDGDER